MGRKEGGEVVTENTGRVCVLKTSRRIRGRPGAHLSCVTLNSVRPGSLSCLGACVDSAHLGLNKFGCC